MSNDTQINIIGNLVADPTLRFTPSGAAVANFTVASTPSTFDKQSNQWKDGETIFMNCAAWRDMAQNIGESLTKGTRVLVQGNLKSRSYDTQDGQRRTVLECDVQEIGASLRNATAKVTRNVKGDTQASSAGSAPRPAGKPQVPTVPDPWAGQQTQADFEEPPF